MKIPFSPPDVGILEAEQVIDALRSGWITTGPKTKELERQVAEFCGANRAVCLGSQTACAEMTLHLLGVGAGDEIITTAYTYTATASVVCHVGAKLVLVDTQKDSFEMDYDRLAEAITDKTKVIIPVDLGGVPCDYDKIFEVVESKKHLFHPKNEMQKAIGRVIIMADTAHAFGATWHGKPVGSFADFSSFSFHAVKNFTTAEGGAVTWKKIDGINDEDIYRNINKFTNVSFLKIGNEIEKSWVSVKNHGGYINKYRPGTRDYEIYPKSSFLCGSDDLNYKVQVYSDTDEYEKYIYLCNSELTCMHYKDIKLLPHENKILPNVFYIFTKNHIEDKYLKDLQNIKFE